ncbi:MAG: methionyl-tRNA formyltransferase [Candidatus Cloacimonetes bacterium]|nr:methionyl-tRNA formyltransferase [Candidatus Cloacimonadota bacterium]
MENKKDIIIATIKSWNIKNAEILRNKFNNYINVHIITKKEELRYSQIEKINPTYIFFPHWSWIIPKKIYNNFECIVFHMTDLPYGRGGSPLQNLIIRNIYDTKISAIKVGKELDSGKIYLKKDFNIKTGNAENILSKISDIIFNEMIPYILNNNPVPYEQDGKVIKFKRRKPEQSDISSANLKNVEDIYDFIRMLDGEGYPKAFFNIGKFKFIFSEINRKSEKLTGRFIICEKKNE